jgi:phosphatidylglycerophosphate synthase
VGTALTAAVTVSLVGFALAPIGVAVAGYAVGAVLAVVLMRRGFPHPELGSGNLVTLARMALVAALLAPLVGIAPPWSVVAVATLALVLDGLDGWLVRREGRVSSFGARLDMEVDSALALIVALNVWAAGITGPLILVIALPRYVFVAAGYLLPWLHQPLPERFGRKVVLVVQVAALITLVSPVPPDWLIVPVVVGVAGALLWSFGRDILWLWRARP